MEVQLARMVSDIESEKETRARVHAELNRKMDSIQESQQSTNKIIAMMLGGLIVIEVVLKLTIH